MDGIQFLKKITKYLPTPVVILSTIAKKGSPIENDARNSGAAIVVDKEDLHLYEGVESVQKVLIPALRAAYISGLKST